VLIAYRLSRTMSDMRFAIRNVSKAVNGSSRPTLAESQAVLRAWQGRFRGRPVADETCAQRPNSPGSRAGERLGPVVGDGERPLSRSRVGKRQCLASQAGWYHGAALRP